MGKIVDKFNAIAYVRPTEKCNLRCKHCFIPPNPSSMSDEQILDIPLQLSSVGITGNVLLQWHGGEPLLIDPFKVEELMVGLSSIGVSTDINFLHGVQTNLVVLNNSSQKKREKWYQVLATYFEKDMIGVSWDEGIRGVNLEKGRFCDYFEKGILGLRESKYFADDFSPVITITAAKPFLQSVSTFIDSVAFFKWLDRRQFNKIHIEKLTPTGDAIQNWSEIGVNNLEYSKTMSKLYLSYTRYKSLHPKSKLAISPFCDLKDAIKTGKQDNVCASGACQTSMFTFSSKGMTKTCTAIAEHSETQLENYQNNVKAGCSECKFNNICNGGCPAHNNVIDFSGECSGAYQLLQTIKSINTGGSS